MISQGSRYIASKLVNVDASSDALPNRGFNITIYNPGPPVFRNVPYRRYLTKQGDTFQLLAYEIYGTTADWWKISDMNPQVFYPSDLAAGIVIRLPMP